MRFGNTLWLIVLCALILFEAKSTSFASEQSGSVRRFAYIIGANDGGPKRILLRYADDDAESFSRVLEDLGGVSPKDRLVLLEPDFSEVINGFSDIAKSMNDIKKGHSRLEFFFYYSGHSDEDGLLLFGKRFRYKDLKKKIDELPADVRVVILDSCSSGAMTRTKGGKHKAPFLSDTSVKLEGHAFLTSSAADEAAQESDKIEGSFFTHYLVSGLRGAADVTNDQRVTLNEAYHYAFSETLNRTETTKSGAQHPTYEIKLSGTGDLVLTELRETSAGIVLASDVEGRLYVRDYQGRLVAEINKTVGKQTVLGLESGDYRLIKDSDSEYALAELSIGIGEHKTLKNEEFQEIDSESTVARGLGEQEKKYFNNPVNFGLFPPAQINKAFESRGEVQNNLSFGLLAAEQDKLLGFGLSGILSWQDYDLVGMQISGITNVTMQDSIGFALGGIVNYTGRDSKGIQLAAIYNHTRRHFYGFQYGIGNYTGGNFYGMQLGLVDVSVGNVSGAQIGLMNFTIDHVAGLQLALTNVTIGRVWGMQLSLANVTVGDVYGAQVSLANVTTGSFRGIQFSHLNLTTGKETSMGVQAGFININVGKIKGAQIGFLNYAEDVTVPIGFVSIVKNGQLHGNFWSSDTALVNVGLKHGSKYVYNIYALGFQPARDALSFYYGVGLGGHIPFVENWFLDMDLMTEWHHGSKDLYFEGQVNKLRLNFGWQFNEDAALLFGPTLNVYTVEHTEMWPDDISYIPARKIHSYNDDRNHIYLGVGFNLGIQI